MSGPIGGYVPAVALHEPVHSDPALRRAAARACAAHATDPDDLGDLLDALGLTREDVETA